MKGKELKCFIDDLLSNENDLPFIIRLKDIISISLEKDSDLNESDANEIKKIFFDREQSISKSYNDYTCTPRSKRNLPWIQLAQILCAEGQLFPFHYYQILYSRVTNLTEKEAIQQIYFFELPLNTLMVSEDNKLMSCVSAIQNAESNKGILGVYHGTVFHKFTKYEEKYFQYNFPKRWLEIVEIKKNTSDKGKLLSKLTIFALIRLIECSTFKSGASDNYSEKEKIVAFKAYNDFKDYLHLLSEPERTYLLDQIIVFGNQQGVMDFGKLFKQITAGEVCLHWGNSFILRLILDYEPDYVFTNKALVTLISSENPFIHESRKKVYSSRSLFKTKELMIASALVILSEITAFSTLVQNSIMILKCKLLEIAVDENFVYSESKLLTGSGVINDIISLYQQEVLTPRISKSASAEGLLTDNLLKHQVLSDKLSRLSIDSSKNDVKNLFIDEYIFAFSEIPQTNMTFFKGYKDKHNKAINRNELVSNCKTQLSSFNSFHNIKFLTALYEFLNTGSGYDFNDRGREKALKLMTHHMGIIESAKAQTYSRGRGGSL